MSRSLVAAVLGALLAVGCHHEEAGPPCSKVVDTERTLMHQMVDGHERIKSASRNVMIAQCEKQQLPVEVRTCLAGATTVAQLASCRRAAPLTEAQLAARNQAGSDRHYVAPPTAGSGSAGSAGSAAAGSGQ